MTRKKVFIADGGNAQYHSLMRKMGFDLVNDIRFADLVLFTGGADVTPMLYGEPKGRYTGCNTPRDIMEVGIFNKARSLNLPILGICRGSQFLCVMSGGRLVQHCTNHAIGDLHPIKTYDNRILRVTSTHHQMQDPSILPQDSYTYLAWADSLSNTYLDGNNEDMKIEKEAEIVYYKSTNALAIQCHPEFDNFPVSSLEYIAGLVDQLMNNNLKNNN